ncbi:MAG: VWA domain-containing protein [Alphaproteobacteria bacterium]|nr:MAG: VWA domain-containing protein [Alphaproteobacteria bacterium]TAF15946.1 MAG: VWA domain-containing protein [Alphaproteobacteria bacterium]TAF41937.1 MAG: VWA domain-containing protein [Alphaproteobacteria bacterium]TAF76760.1 MAG: VWA domain-containing protein [Alphaproteobacteria bacterium]
MHDPLDEIAHLMRQGVPPAHDVQAEERAIAAAMQRFSQKNASRAQGNAFWLRLMNAAHTVLHNNQGAFMKKSYKVAGGLCAATLIIALLNSTMLHQEVQSTMVASAPNPISAPLTEAMPDLPPAPAPAQDASMEGILTQLEPSAMGASNAPQAIKPQDLAKISPSAKRPKAFAAPMQKHNRADYAMPYVHHEGRDQFPSAAEHPLTLVKEEAVSTFSVDVDTASYAFLRASLNNHSIPPKDAVRIEEMINYFPYDYAPPKDKQEPFAPTVSIMPTPWNKETKLLHIGIKGYEIVPEHKPRSNLVFLIDTSGSMDEPNKLPLLKNSMKLLLQSLEPEDSVAIVTYAGSAGIALEPTKVREKQVIINAIEHCYAGGGTAGAEGIKQAYALAERHFDKDGINRIILATDGDFNVGIADPEALKDYVAKKRTQGIFLSVLGFGQGNYHDTMMQSLAQNGNGNAAYIDRLNEARKVLVDEASSTLYTIAKDVKIQVEFNPQRVEEYRLIGYETRALRREDFNNDAVDAGEIGAGHSVTALYEITPTESKARLIDAPRYGAPSDAQPSGADHATDHANEYGFLKIRYKLPKQDTSRLMSTPITHHKEVKDSQDASNDARFAAAVAAFGQLMRGSTMMNGFSYADVIALAQQAKGRDPFGYRAEFIELVRLAQLL